MVDRLRSVFRKFWYSWGREISVVLAIVIPLRSSIADWNDVPTGSMEPTVLVGDRIFVNKLAYGFRIPLTKVYVARWAEPQRGDIVVCFSPEDGKRLVKRVVGVPGDSVELRRNRLIINGVPARYERIDEAMKISDPPLGRQDDLVFAKEHFGEVDHPVLFTPWLRAPRDYGPVVVPKGQFFMMGDNRDISLDSRFFGFIPRRQIVGRVPAVVYSDDPDRFVVPRGDRWFKSIR